jgi:hypothetical protein
MVASFLARAVVKFAARVLVGENNDRPGDPVESVTLLSREHCTARLERVSPAMSPVAELKKDMDQLLQEYSAQSRTRRSCSLCQGIASTSLSPRTSQAWSVFRHGTRW